MPPPTRKSCNRITPDSILKDALYVGASILRVILYASCILTVLSFAEGQGWLLNLLCHFRVQYLVIQMIALALLAVLKDIRSKKWPIAIGLAGALLNVSQILPLYIPRVVNGPPQGFAAVRIVQLNVNSKNKHYDWVINYIKETKPDIVAIQEATPALVSALTPALPDYKVQQAVARWDNFGLLLLSRFPIMESTVWQFSEGLSVSTPNAPATVTRLRLPNSALTVVNCHLLNAFSSHTFSLQEKQLTGLAATASNIRDNLVVVGDLNTTSWSHVFTDFLRATNLVDGRQGIGIQPTWPSIRPVLLIPIDHCLVSRNIAVSKRIVGPNVGSDHFPVLSEILVPNEPDPQL